MDHSQLWETTLDPENRTLIQLTSDDVQRDMNTFGLLHSKKTKFASERKNMMAKYKISIDDIDN